MEERSQEKPGKSNLKLKKVQQLKNFDKPRHSVISVLSLSDITEEALDVWNSLPDEIKNDPSLAAFRSRHAELLGESEETETDKEKFQRLDSLDYDNEEDQKVIAICVVNDKDDVKNVIVNPESQETVDAEKQPLTTKQKIKKSFNYVKIALLLAAWGMFTYFMMSNGEHELEARMLSISEGVVKSFLLHEPPIKSNIKLHFEGAFLTVSNDDLATDYMHYYLTVDNHGQEHNITDLLRIPIVNSSLLLDTSPDLERTSMIQLSDKDFESLQKNESHLMINILTNLTTGFPVKLTYNPDPMNQDLGVILAALVLVGLYVLIVWELVHRTFAAIIASTTALGILAAMNEKPSLEQVVEWIDVETLLLLFGMMILVAVLSETGVFDYLAVFAYKITNGKIWPLIICLCFFTAIVSSILDNVTTILLMTPVTIRLCEVMELNPIPILLFTVIYSNIGGTMTPVGDPPNVIISSNSYISKNGINFTNFTLHMASCIVFVMVQAYFQLRLMFRDMNSLRSSEPKAVTEIRREIGVWQRAASSLSVSRGEGLVRKTLDKKIERLNRVLEQRLKSKEMPKESYIATLGELQAKYPIRNKKLLYKSCVALVFVVTFFFMHSLPEIQQLSLGWTALLGAVLLLILYDREDIEGVLAHVEWATLLFFAALFVLMEALTELGLIEWIGRQTENVIMSVGEDSRLAVAILIILWVSAIASAFVDNIPLTTMMIKIVISLAENETLDLPLQPLVWSLALGACLGGNGTLIGASANVVCAGVAEQYGYKLTFIDFFKVGFPIMIGSVIVATGYMMVAHVLFTWH